MNDDLSTDKNETDDDFDSIQEKLGNLLKSANMKVFNTDDLTPDCFLIQMWGLSACDNCSAADTNECGGEQIRKSLIETGQHGKIGKDGL